MFSRLLFASIALFLLLPMAWADSGATATKRAILRAAPDKEAAGLSVIAPGTRLHVLGSEPPFLRVQLPGGKVGWVAERLVDVDGEEARNTPANAAAPVASTTQPPADTTTPTATSTEAPAIPVPVGSAVAAPAEASAAALPGPSPATHLLPTVPLWLIIVLLLAGALIGFAAGYAYRERYYRKKLHGLRV